MIIFLRRKLLGAGSLRGMTAFIEGNNITTKAMGKSAIFFEGERCAIVRNDKLVQHEDLIKSSDLLVRWGCTTGTGVPLDKQVNPSDAIHQVGDKAGFRKHCMENDPDIVPFSVFNDTPIPDNIGKMVLRPPVHSQGKKLWLTDGPTELKHAVIQNGLQGGWYASEFIDKAAEFRVYVGSGRVITVAEKTPENPNAVAWNVAQGGRFDVVKWGDWNFNVLNCAIRAYNLTKLDFAGVDIMVDKNGRAYLIEINSAPSLPLLSDNSVSYRQECMGKYFLHLLENGKDRLELGDTNNWRGYIHPAIWSKK